MKVVEAGYESFWATHCDNEAGLVAGDEAMDPDIRIERWEGGFYPGDLPSREMGLTSCIPRYWIRRFLVLYFGESRPHSVRWLGCCRVLDLGTQMFGSDTWAGRSP